MSEWIKLYSAAFTHPKTRRMAKRLGMAPAAVVGHLSCLWSFAAEFAPDGDLSRFDVEEIELGSGWDGDDGVFLKAAVKSGYIDQEAVDKYAIHDWSEYGGKLVEQRAAERKRSANRRASAGRQADDQSTTSGRPLAERKKERKKEKARAGASAVDNSHSARAEEHQAGSNSYCACGGELQWDGDGTGNKHCPVCGAKVPAPGGLSLPPIDVEPDRDARALADCIPAVSAALEPANTCSSADTRKGATP